MNTLHIPKKSPCSSQMRSTRLIVASASSNFPSAAAAWPSSAMLKVKASYPSSPSVSATEMARRNVSSASTSLSPRKKSRPCDIRSHAFTGGVSSLGSAAMSAAARSVAALARGQSRTRSRHDPLLEQDVDLRVRRADLPRALQRRPVVPERVLVAPEAVRA